MKKNNRNKGITLIALVVTIVALLILAGVSINLVIGNNGIITMAQKAKEKTEDARKTEENNIKDYELYIKESTGKKVYSLGETPKLMDNPPTITNVGSSPTIENYTFIKAISNNSTGEVNNVFTSFNADLVQANKYYPKYDDIVGLNNLYSASTTASNFYSIEFSINCQEFELKTRYTGTNYYRILVDEGNGYELTSELGMRESEQEGTVNAVYYYNISFAEKKDRNIKIELRDLFSGICISSDDSINKIKRNANPTAVFIGSSITESTAGNTSAYLGYPNVICSKLGLECINNGVGSTGYLATANNTRYKYYDRLQYSIIERQPDIAIIEGGINDIGYDTDAIIEEADKCFKKIINECPNTKLIISGVFWPKGTGYINDQVLKLNTELRKLALSNNLPFIDFITGDTIAEDGTVITSGTNSYITGNGCVGNEQHNGNADIYIASDSTHLTKEGHKYIGNKLAEEFVKILNY